jgi:hypothetical protein
VQKEAKKEAMGPNSFKANNVYDAGEIEDRQPTKTVKEGEKEKTLISAPAEKEENSDDLLTQWKQELKMLEELLKNQEP